jgi:Cu/Zn superoxide dismutase
MNEHCPSVTFGLRAVLVTATVTMLAACGSTSSIFGSKRETDSASSGPSPGLVASLRGLGAAVSGKVRVIDRGDGITLLISAINMPIGEYRVAFHQNGNCSSPNGFSAGPAWAPAGLSPTTLVPSFMTANSRDGNAETSAYIKGVHTIGENGLAGRSVILYAGSTIPEIRPGEPTSAFACGVFEPAQPFRF